MKRKYNAFENTPEWLEEYFNQIEDEETRRLVRELVELHPDGHDVLFEVLSALRIEIHGSDMQYYYVQCGSDGLVHGINTVPVVMAKIHADNVFEVSKENYNIASENAGYCFYDEPTREIVIADRYAQIDKKGDVVNVIPRNPRTIIMPLRISAMSLEHEEMKVDNTVQAGMRRVNGEFIYPDTAAEEQAEREERIADLTAQKILKAMQSQK